MLKKILILMALVSLLGACGGGGSSAAASPSGSSGSGSTGTGTGIAVPGSFQAVDT